MGPSETPLIRTISVNRVASELGVSAWTIRTWCREGRLPFVKLGRRVLIKIDDLDLFIATHYTPARRP